MKMRVKSALAALAAVGLAGCDEDLQEIRSPEPPFKEGAKHVACVMDGVDFGGQNDQELTWYANESRFLNGSFESGGRYWRNNFSGCDIRKSCIYEGDAHTGRRCLWVRGMDFVSSHGLGIRPGRYTISWWAKKPPSGRAWSGVSLWSQIGMRDAHGKLYGGKGNDRPLTDEWQKFSWTFDWKVLDRDDPKPGDYWHAGTKGYLTNIDPKVGDAFGTMHEYATMLFMK